MPSVAAVAAGGGGGVRTAVSSARERPSRKEASFAVTVSREIVMRMSPNSTHAVEW